jgi:hypothetical protein
MSSQDTSITLNEPFQDIDFGSFNDDEPDLDQVFSDIHQPSNPDPDSGVMLDDSQTQVNSVSVKAKRRPFAHAIIDELDQNHANLLACTGQIRISKTDINTESQQLEIEELHHQHKYNFIVKVQKWCNKHMSPETYEKQHELLPYLNYPYYDDFGDPMPFPLVPDPPSLVYHHTFIYNDKRQPVIVAPPILNNNNSNLANENHYSKGLALTDNEFSDNPNYDSDVSKPDNYDSDTKSVISNNSYVRNSPYEFNSTDSSDTDEDDNSNWHGISDGQRFLDSLPRLASFFY